MTNNVQAKADSQMTVEQVSEKYNGGKKIINFIGRKKSFSAFQLRLY